MRRLFGVDLPVPRFDRLDEAARLPALKKFCGGLLEDRCSHLWHGAIEKARLSSDSRMSLAMSLFLFRKVIPSSPPSIEEYAQRMSIPSEEPDPGFLDYVRKRVPQLFPEGWDMTLYPNAAINAVLPVKSCLQLGQGRGGARGYGCGQRWNSHEDYVLDVLTRETAVHLEPSRVVSVETGGKHRIVSTSDVNANLFRPLHTAMYNHLSKFPWLLRGDAKASRFNEFCVEDGLVFVSGDYESATDNLNGHLQREMLDLILKNSRAVPKGIVDSAHLMLSTELSVQQPKVQGPDGKWMQPEAKVYRQERGQLMGNLLSFPLLCLVNYLGFRYYSRTKGGVERPVRVNGDDIVFKATAEEAKAWMEGVVGAGLTLSKGKTLVDKRYFSLNSTLFKAQARRVQQIPMVRSTAFGFSSTALSADGLDGVSSLAGRFRSFRPGFFGRRREMLNTEFLKWNNRYILASRRSITRGLGMKVTRTELIHSGLYEREAFYLSFPDGAEKPLPVKRSILEQNRKPTGWSLRRVERITKEMRQLQKDVVPLFVEMAWNPGANNDADVRESEYSRKLWEGGFTWTFGKNRPAMKKRARLLGLSPRNARRYLSPKLYDEDLRLRERLQVWLPDGWSSTNQMAAQPTVEPSPQLPDEKPSGEPDVESSIDLTMGKTVRIKQDDSWLYYGARMSCRVYENGGVGFGPPISYRGVAVQ